MAGIHHHCRCSSISSFKDQRKRFRIFCCCCMRLASSPPGASFLRSSSCRSVTYLLRPAACPARCPCLLIMMMRTRSSLTPHQLLSADLFRHFHFHPLLAFFFQTSRLQISSPSLCPNQFNEDSCKSLAQRKKIFSAPSASTARRPQSSLLAIHADDEEGGEG